MIEEKIIQIVSPWPNSYPLTDFLTQLSVCVHNKPSRGFQREIIRFRSLSGTGDGVCIHVCDLGTFGKSGPTLTCNVKKRKSLVKMIILRSGHTINYIVVSRNHLFSTNFRNVSEHQVDGNEWKAINIQQIGIVVNQWKMYNQVFIPFWTNSK
jgi:hypothetical protein